MTATYERYYLTLFVILVSRAISLYNIEFMFQWPSPRLGFQIKNWEFNTRLRLCDEDLAKTETKQMKIKTAKEPNNNLINKKLIL